MTSRKLALIMGVANQRSIAWACVQSFLSRNYDCILTYQSARFEKTVQKLIEQKGSSSFGRILGALTRELAEQDLIHKPDIGMTGNHSSLVALTYLGAVRAVPNYQSMGPAKAALEAMVRGLALEYGPTHQLHVNAVSAGPIATAAARGGIRNFSTLQQAVKDTSPLRRNVSAEEVANVVSWLSDSTGVTGQTVYVDGGYSSVVPIAL
ncbi:hypothetical protein FisN_4Lh108 [Fistulifera solaris]|uniref:Enoyl-[acyl-carrier-protein] reductase (NADH) n=1 Tax=Fistulifera solaris TaxID=1519565 RepID=A0A1Z5JZ39_FISSO|nr:hypothetical protein FisN_4Lh108 [Fistulifera solaris]|eukprot:GAX19313.1 hypothetical protein FisN_4Lh108 [Fistulifera solaris]